ncbi:hypothetical protein Srufu_048900 [Streptomyces libani subsp. rufus]|nr:hypothetical protein Srufu_048900 [Streptomyces libani subsp. rufus]
MGKRGATRGNMWQHAAMRGNAGRPGTAWGGVSGVGFLKGVGGGILAGRVGPYVAWRKVSTSWANRGGSSTQG